MVEEWEWLRGCMRRLVWSHREARDRLVILPLGSLEDRPTGPAQLDTLLALAASCRLAARCDALLAWPLGYGYSPMHRRWSGPRQPRLLEELLVDILQGLRGMGARRLLVVDGHLGHMEHAARAAGAAGAAYISLWRLLEAWGGLREWSEQLGYEKLLSTTLPRGVLPPPLPRILERAASSICGARRPG